MIEFFEERRVIIDEYIKNGHVEINSFLSQYNFSIQALFELNILVYKGYIHTAQLYDFVISDSSKNIIFQNNEYQIILVYADKVQLLKQMIESFIDNNKAPYSNIVHEFKASINIDQKNVKNETLCIIENIIEVLGTDPMANIDTCITINANFPGGTPNRIREMVNKNIQKISEIEYTWN